MLDRAREAGIETFLVPAVHFGEVEELFELAEREPGVWLALGVHPHEAGSWEAAGGADRLRELLRHPKVVAVGECGLDLHYQHFPLELQERVFLEQLEVAAEFELPAVVHHRDAPAELAAILNRRDLQSLRFDLHSYAGGLGLARNVPRERAWFGFSGMITFPKANNVREVLPEIPADRVLIETDTPYLAPVPHRGKRNEPGHLPWILERLAAERGWSVEEAARKTAANFYGLFTRAHRFAAAESA